MKGFKGRTPKKSRSSRGSKISKTVKDVVNTKVEGIGSYAKGKLTKGGLFGSNKPSSGLTRRQAYNLEKGALQAQKMAISSKPEMIRAVGQALAMNTTGAQTGIATGIASKLNSSPSNQTGSINNLVNGGANITNKNNAEEEEDTNDFSKEYVVR